MRHCLWLLALCASTIIASQVDAAQPKNAKSVSTQRIEAVLKHLESIRQQQQIPGMAIAIIHKGKVVTKGLGLRDIAGQKPVTPSTLFAIGSTTKAMTAAALAILVERGKWSWQRAIQRALPTFRLSDDFASQRANAIDALTHRTGLPRHDLTWYGSKRTRRQLLAGLKHLQLSKGFRSEYQYNNLMYMVAGMLVGKLDNSSWETFLRREIFAPLGIKSACFSTNVMKTRPDHALPYVRKAGKTKRVPFRNIDAIGPAGSINASVKDMAKWVQLHLSNGKYNGRQLLRAKSIKKLRSPHVVVPSHRVKLLARTPNLGHISYGLGWMISRFRDNRIVFHTGGIDGYTALVSFMPQRDLGFVMLTNKGRNSTLSTMMLEVYERLLGLGKVDRLGHFAGMLAALQKKKKDKRKPMPAQPGTTPSHPLTTLAGKYQHPAYGTLVLKANAKRLKMTYHSLSFDFQHFHYNVFQAVDKKGKALSAKFKITFHLDIAGRIDEVRVPWQGGVKDIRFRKQHAKRKTSKAATKHPHKRTKAPLKKPTTARKPLPVLRLAPLRPLKVKPLVVRRIPPKRRTPTPIKPAAIKYVKPSYSTFANLKAVIAAAKQANRPIFLDLFATWCVPCKKLEAKTFAHPLMHPLLKRYIVVRFDTDQPVGKALAARFGVRWWPTTLLLNAKGQEVERIIGYYAARQFRPPVLAVLQQKGTYKQLRQDALYRSTTPINRLAYADRLMLRREVNAARQIYMQLWKEDPKNAKGVGAWALYGVARSFSRLGKHAFTLLWIKQFHSQFKSLTPAHIEAYRLQLYALEQKNQEDEHKTLLNKFRRLYPGKHHSYK